MPPTEEVPSGLSEDGTGGLGLINWKAGGMTDVVVDVVVLVQLVAVEDSTLTGKEDTAVVNVVGCF